MRMSQARFLSSALDHCGVPHELLEHYSGRGMYGNHTAAIVLENPLELVSSVLQYVVDMDPDDIVLIDNLCSDNMGKSQQAVY